MKFIIFLAFIGFIGFCGVFVWQHEKVHQVIYEDYGIKSRIDLFNWDFVAYTEAENECPNNDCRLAQEMTESIGYQLSPMYGILILGLLILFMLLEEQISELRTMNKIIYEITHNTS